MGINKKEMTSIKRAGILAPITVALLATAGIINAQDNSNSEAQKCLLRDDYMVSGQAILWDRFGGGIIDDGEVLLEKWSPGMGVREVDYCQDRYRFKSVRLVVGDNDGNLIPLRKHGGEGGECRKWILQPDDYIREIQYTFSNNLFYVVEITFKTNQGELRTIGSQMGTKVNFDFNYFQPFVGFYSYEWEDTTMAFGVYEDDCHGTVSKSKLPFGFGTLNVPSMSEIKGEQNSVSKTWINDQSGTSAGQVEIEVLEEIVKIEEKLDEVIEEPDQKTTHIINESFDTINIIIEVTPFKQPEEPADEVPELKEKIVATETPELPELPVNDEIESPQGLANPNEQNILKDPALMEEALKVSQDEKERQEFEQAVANEVESETQALLDKLEKSRKQNEQLTLKLTQERVQPEESIRTVNEVQSKDGPPESLTWILLAVVCTVLVMMIGFITCCFFYLRSQKRQRLNALEVKERSRRRSELEPSESSDNEASMKSKKVRLQHADGINFGMAIGTPVDGQPINNGLVDVDHLQASNDTMNGTQAFKNPLASPTKTGLMAGRDSTTDPLQPQPCISGFNNQIDKENAADSVVEAEDVKLEFTDIKETDGLEKSTFAAAQPQNYDGNANVAPIDGRNPFQETVNSPDDDDADLCLTEGSGRGISNSGPMQQANTIGGNTPNNPF